MSNYLQIRQRRRLLPILLLLMSLSTSLSTFARDFTYQGVNYTVIDEDAKTCKTKEGKFSNMWGWSSGSSVSGVLELPQEAYDGSSWYKLIHISSYSFYECENLESVIIPEGVINIAGNAFYGCENLISVKLPDTLENIYDYAFVGCSKLESINLSQNLVSIGGAAFLRCMSLSSLNIPSSVKTIGSSAFADCTGLGTIVVEGNATIGSSAFKGCILRPLSLKGKIEMKGNALNGLNSDSYILCRQADLEDIKRDFNGSVYNLDIPYSVASCTPLICGVKISFGKNPYYDGDADKIKMKAHILDHREDNHVYVDCDINPKEENLITGLHPGKDDVMTLSWNPEHEGYASEFNYSFRTKNAYVSCSYDATQTTITIHSVNADGDESITPKVYIDIDGEKKEYNGGKFEIKGLNPNRTYCFVFADYNGEWEKDYQYTKAVGMNTSFSNVAPTSIKLSGSFDPGDAKVTSSGWESQINGEWIKLGENNKTIAYGLKPESSQSFRYFVRGNDYVNYSKEIKVTLPALEMEMLKPKCVSSTNAIVAAKTNIADDEPNVGFQWKKYDAPATLEPNEAYAVVCDGMLEGYIRNLQTTSFYNVRAFYKDAEGNYYYSDWTTFDPSDFSYFEPTVRTYPVEEVSSSTATVRGYALPGTDNIKSQGFQYWRSGGAAEAVAFAPASTEIVTVPVSGQVMTTTFENLDESTTYVYRAYAETDAGFTYGEEMSFTTESASGVSTLWPDSDKAEAPTIVCYYNLQGQRFSQPQPGLNIVLYSDGTTRKIMTRR